MCQLETLGKFSIFHYAGKVTYTADGFVLKNSDTMHADSISLMRSCSALTPLAHLLIPAESPEGSSTRRTDEPTRFSRDEIAISRDESASQPAGQPVDPSPSSRPPAAAAPRSGKAEAPSPSQPLEGKASPGSHSRSHSQPPESKISPGKFSRGFSKLLGGASSRAPPPSAPPPPPAPAPPMPPPSVRAAISTREPAISLAISTREPAISTSSASRPRRGANLTLGGRLRAGIGEVSSKGGAPTGLMGRLRQTSVHYVRCVKPNDSMAAFGFEQRRVLLQLQYSGVLEMVRIRRQGFPQRMPFATFEAKFAPLLLDLSKSFDRSASALSGLTGGIKRAFVRAEDRDERDQADAAAAAAEEAGHAGCMAILERANLFEHRHFVFGKTLVFLRNGVEGGE